MSRTIQKVADRFKLCATDILYYTYVLFTFRKIEMMSNDEMFDKLEKHGYSLARFGNGEFLWMLQIRDERSFNQPNSPELAEALLQALTDHQEKLLIGILDIFHGVKQFTYPDNQYMRWFARKNSRYFDKWLQRGYPYCDSTATRCYYYRNKDASVQTSINRWKSVFHARDVVLIEGAQTRFGVGNDLLDGASSVRRILAPPENAFAQYETILTQAKKLPMDCLILIALGPTATVLAYDLAKAGYQAIDIGHLDIEYEWYLRKTKEKIPIPGKYVNEKGKAPTVGLEAFPLDEQQKYHAQIIAKIDNQGHM